MNVLYGITCVVGIIFMCISIFIGIWLFIVALKAFKQLKYKNYILEKMYQKMNKDNSNINEPIDMFDGIKKVQGIRDKD